MKTMEKRWIARLLAAAMLLAMLPTGMMTLARAETLSGTCGASATWTLDTDTGVLQINGTGEMTSYAGDDHNGSVELAPWNDNREAIKHCVIADGITSIGDNNFYCCSAMTDITLPDSLVSIGADAFICTGLTSVTLPDGLISIGNAAFSECMELTSITIPDSVTSIGNSVFFCTKLTSVTIPDSVTSIGNSAFRSCGALTDVKWSANATSIPGSVFLGSGLTSFTIPDGVTSIGIGAFYYCSDMTSVTIPDSVTSIGAKAFSECSSLTSVKIPDGVTSIAQCAFEGCRGLTSVTIPDKVTTLGLGAFTNCTGLTSVTIPRSVTSIGQLAFSSCRGLTDVNYGGNKKEWKAIVFGENNEHLTDANIQFLGDDNTTHKYDAFTDIDQHWAYPTICYCVENGYLNGVSDTLFAPDSNMTRAMAVTLLWRIEGSQAGAVNPFSDVPSGTWYTDAVAWANSNSIVTGYSANKFGPNDTITREQLATILYRYAKFKNENPSDIGNLEKFSDASAVSDYAKGALQWAVSNELIKGRTETTLVPQGTATRAEVATLIQRFLTAQV